MERFSERADSDMSEGQYGRWKPRVIGFWLATGIQLDYGYERA